MVMDLVLQVAWPGDSSALGQSLAAARHWGVLLLAAGAVMAAGVLVATLAGGVLQASLRWARFDDGVRQLLGAAGSPRFEPTRLVAVTVRVLVLIVAGVVAFKLLGVPLAASVGARLGEVVPRIVTSALLLAIGSLIALAAGAIVSRLLDRTGVRPARFQGQVITFALTGFSVLLALDQLGFAAQFVMALGVVAAATAVLGLALAFGLGCRELARDFLVEYLRAQEDGEPRGPK